MIRVILHIGTHKTGTSSIQRLLHERAGSIGLQDGSKLLYPRAGRLVSGNFMPSHAALAWFTVGDYEPRWPSGFEKMDMPQAWGDLRNEIDDAGAEVVILSAAGFSRASDGEVDEIRRQLANYSVEVVVYLRNHIGFARSVYLQGVRSGRYRQSFSAFVPGALQLLDYGGLLRRWSTAFGRANLRIRLYDKVKADVCSDFLSVVGGSCDVESQVRENVSPPDHVVNSIRILNAIERVSPGRAGPLFHKARRQLLAQRGLGRAIGRFARSVYRAPTVGPVEAEQLRLLTCRSKQEFLEEFIPPADRHYFDP